MQKVCLMKEEKLVDIIRPRCFFCYTFFDVGQKCSVQFCERVWRKRFLFFKVGALRFVFIFGSRMVVSVYSICFFLC